jgi:hypothetical protein
MITLTINLSASPIWLDGILTYEPNRSKTSILVIFSRLLAWKEPSFPQNNQLYKLIFFGKNSSHV